MLKQTLTGARSLLTGMKVTFKNAFKKPVTSQYPPGRRDRDPPHALEDAVGHLGTPPFEALAVPLRGVFDQFLL